MITYSSEAGANEGLKREQSQGEETKTSHLEGWVKGSVDGGSVGVITRCN